MPFFKTQVLFKICYIKASIAGNTQGGTP